jgi:hypothetical protein
MSLDFKSTSLYTLGTIVYQLPDAGIQVSEGFLSSTTRYFEKKNLNETNNHRPSRAG